MRVASLLTLPGEPLKTPFPPIADRATPAYTTLTNQDEHLGKYDQVLGEKDHIQALTTLKSVSALADKHHSKSPPASWSISNAATGLQSQRRPYAECDEG
jgi:hypothetical protein